jgi:glucokinase
LENFSTIQFQVNQEAASLVKIIGIDLGGTKIRAGLLAKVALIRVCETATRSQDAQQVIVDQICDLIDNLLDGEVGGIGVGVPAIVDTGTGVVYETAQIPSWQQVPLRTLLERRYGGVPVYVSNDSNCFAMAEFRFGNAQGFSDVAAVTIGSGLGVGLILGGRLYSGQNGGAGELGRIVYRDSRVTDYCSGKFFVREYGKTGAELLVRARAGDAAALEAFERFGWHLGKGLSMLVHMVDPQLIVLGGGVAHANDFFRQSMLRSLEEAVYRRSFSRLRIMTSELGDSAVLGAAALCLTSSADEVCRAGS